MKCPKCDEELINNKCPICGLMIVEDNDDDDNDDGIVYFEEDDDNLSEQSDDNNDETGIEANSSHSTSSGNNMVIGIVAVALIAIIGFVVFNPFSSKNSDVSKDTPSPATSENGIEDVKEGIREIKEGVNSVKEEIKKDLEESPVGQIKEGIDDVKEIVDDIKDIKAIVNGEARAPFKAKKCKGKNYLEVQEAFEDAGFTDVVLKEDKDLKVGLLHDDGDVESVTISGNSKFDEGDKFPSDSEVIITYHTYHD